jgi:N-acetylneuraminic acid mutarotase
VKPLLAFVLIAVAVAAAGCGSNRAVSLGDAPQQTAASVATTTQAAPTATSVSFDVWFARGEQLVSEPRMHAATPRVATAALDALLAGPTPAERAAGDTTAIPTGTRLLAVSVKNRVATVDLTSDYESGGGSLSMQVRLAQVVYTLTQFSTVKTVRFALDGTPVNVFSSEGIVLDHPVGRSDYANLISGSSVAAAPLAGTWRSLPAPPIALEVNLTSVWTGTEMLIYGVRGVAPDGNFLKASNALVAYNPASRAWRRLADPVGQAQYLGRHPAFWTGKEMLVWPDRAFNPATNEWRQLPQSPASGGGLVVWTGREMIGWGGGCCGDAFSDGAAYNPTTNTWRKLRTSPLAPSQSPIGTWTGHELIVFVGDFNPDGKPWPAHFARAAAYNPVTDTWRRIARIPSARGGAAVVWDGHEALVVGGADVRQTGKPVPLANVGYAYNPTTNRWRRLPPMESGRTQSAAVWTGKTLLLWGGSQTVDRPVVPPHGLAYDPTANRWSPLPQAPLLGRLDPTAVWTGRQLIVWGGQKPGAGLKSFADGAAFTPAP